ncbi:MAG TPA: FAD-dependent oxidoreductase [Streptosporangiaceae bacterium]
MSMDSPDVLVVGAGVCGLSSAITLLDAGLRVVVYAAQPPQRTTSAVAGALWGPHLVGADERVGRWASATLAWFRDLVAEPAAGVREVSGLAASLHDGTADPPEFVLGAGPLARADPAALPPGYASGWTYSAPVVTMPAYLDYLLDLLLSKGGQLRLGLPLASLTDAERHTAAPVIVNCAGIGARDLVPDPDLIPVRGQVVVVANPGITEFFVGEREGPDEVTYFFPHGPTVVLGGTQQPGEESTRPDPATSERILAHCARAEPRLAGASVLGHKVGLRPVRPTVRLEVQEIGGGRHIVHNYGHGGAGVTLSLGCAQTVLQEVAGLLGHRETPD